MSNAFVWLDTENDGAPCPDLAAVLNDAQVAATNVNRDSLVSRSEVGARTLKDFDAAR